MLTSDVKMGDRFVYTAPSGREIVYVVDDLEAVTPQGRTMPRAVSRSQVVFLHDELLAQSYWKAQPDDS